MICDVIKKIIRIFAFIIIHSVSFTYPKENPKTINFTFRFIISMECILNISLYFVGCPTTNIILEIDYNKKKRVKRRKIEQQNQFKNSIETNLQIFCLELSPFSISYSLFFPFFHLFFFLLHTFYKNEKNTFISLL